MGSYHQAMWLSDGRGQTRTERKNGRYFYYVPTKLSTLLIRLDSDVVADIVRAEKALLSISSGHGGLQAVDGLSRFLLRAEAISSSYIEGLRLGAKRLMQAELNETEPNTFKYDAAAAEIVGNIQALNIALKQVEISPEIVLSNLTEIHAALLEHMPLADYAGQIREVQNWIGGNSYNPINAAHVPPAPELVPDLLADLLDYCNREDVSPIQQAALAHAQFETIHPFVDGNGRIGRALIHLILRRRGLLQSSIAPISLIMATYSKSYIAGLNSVRFEGEQPGLEASEAINEWLSFFAGCCVRACDEIIGFADKANAIEQAWRADLGSVRRNSSLDILLGKLIGMPVFTVSSATQALERSFTVTNQAVQRLVTAGVAKPLSSSKRNRAFEVPAAMDAFRAFERKLASPTGNTRTAKPVRTVPYRK
jgi:Fic family protein